MRALHAVIHADHRRPHRGILPRQLANVVSADSRPCGYPLRRIFLHALPQLLKTQRVLADVILVVKFFIDDHVHHRQRQSNVCSWIDGQIPVSALRCPRFVRIDHYQLCAVAPRFRNERPQMHVGRMNVRAPRNDVFGIAKLLRLRPNIASSNTDHACAAGRSADRAIQLRSAQPMKKPVRHSRITQHTHVAGIGIWKNRLGTKLIGNLLEARADFVQRLVP